MNEEKLMKLGIVYYTNPQKIHIHKKKSRRRQHILSKCTQMMVYINLIRRSNKVRNASHETRHM